MTGLTFNLKRVVTICIVSWLPNATLGALQAAGNTVPLISAESSSFPESQAVVSTFFSLEMPRIAFRADSLPPSHDPTPNPGLLPTKRAPEKDPYMDFKEQTKTSSCRKLLPFLFLQLILSMVIFAYIRNVQQTESSVSISPALEPLQQLQISTSIDKGPQEITILLWTWPFGQPFDIPKCSSLFNIRDCHFTTNRSWHAKADAILIRHADVCNSRRFPLNSRPPSQRWIWFNWESPSNSPNLRFMDNLFNLTMSYRRDSDIFSPYGWLEVLDQLQNVTIPLKSKLVAWVVSHWSPSFRRVQYYQELKKYIQIDVYGRQHLPLPKDKLLSTLTQYKFYLSFENSIHEDYITEKLWKNAFLSMAVPVVCGPPRKNYEQFLPPDSFIHIEDFPSAQELAHFLHALDKDDVRYQSYFHWRSQFKPIGLTNMTTHYCKACWALQETPVQYKVVPELSKWFK